MRNVLFIVLLSVVGAGSFYGGMVYQKKRAPTASADLQNLSPQERRQRFQDLSGRNSGPGEQGGGQRFRGGGAVSGEVIAKDGSSLTLRLRDGGSRIVFYTSSTNVGKFAQGSIDDVAVGGQATVMGNPNADGSITAESLQLRPERSASDSPATGPESQKQ